MNNMPKRILYIWDADYPWDVRVEKICTTLARNGYTVHIAARNLKRLPEYEIENGLVIHRIKTWKNETMNYFLSFPAFFSPIWKRFLDQIIKENDIGLIIVRDLPMAIAGIWAAKRHRIPIIFDMAENYVDMIWANWKARKFQGLNYFVRNPYLAKLVERYVLRESDYILVVVEEARDLVITRGGISDRISIVGNTPLLESFKRTEVKMSSDLQKIKDHFSIIYTGGLQKGRGIQTILDAIPLLVNKIPNFLFVVVGDGYAVYELKKMAMRNNSEKHVFWVGWVDHRTVYDYCRMSKVGIIPHLVTGHTNTTIPNKIFDYMGLGLPVIASNAAPMKRILEEEGCGLIFRSGDSNDFACKLLELYQLGYDLGHKGKVAVRERYNWGLDEARLLNVINKFSSRDSGQI